MRRGLRVLERVSGHYSNTPESEFYLDRAKQTYIGNFFEMLNARDYPFWGSLEEALKTARRKTRSSG
jgi:hypothetical protein